MSVCGSGASKLHAGFVALLLLAASARGLQAEDASVPRLSFDELVTLSNKQDLDPALAAKLKVVLTTPVVDNRTGATAAPAKLRVTEWNIERGQNLDEIERMLSSPDGFLKEAQAARKKVSANELERLRSEIRTLRESDVLILNEVDIGVKRTDYRNVVKELSDALGMSSVYGVEFLEVDSLVSLGTEKAVLDTPELSARMTDDLKPDRSKYQGLHVNAILSRYPLRNVRVISLPVCHDWFAAEQEEISKLEKAKRKTADVVFLERIGREVRRGNRNALVADIELPDAAKTTVRLVNAHLENKCKADCRAKQMRAVLENVSDTPGALVLAGDWNTTGTDGTPTSVRYEIVSRVKDYQFWLGTLMQFTPVSLPFYATAPFKFWKNYRDPTAMHIPVLGRNPEAAMFGNLRKYRFQDGGSFDFSGDAARNLQKSKKTLSDSNERAGKGFVPTFGMKRTFGGVIRYRLDWIVVKPGATANAAMRPETPVTLTKLNGALPEDLSDHAPIATEMATR
ncbi:endonuclease/exonuclease/phosphatase family protein [Granulicella sibirica]|uniref:Endonuclease/exonuclease/phosphatase domain-containing protein n=1 Tax=Granulicella sibirica TaxID=2479048 RepID=A0A4Q0SWV4_9BACT|nr:hypothetical protein [Granulicella sibirica]RXH54430.1 hypothetical protein GRAN_4726 [Granulicella sibirica]